MNQANKEKFIPEIIEQIMNSEELKLKIINDSIKEKADTQLKKKFQQSIGNYNTNDKPCFSESMKNETYDRNKLYMGNRDAKNQKERYHLWKSYIIQKI